MRVKISKELLPDLSVIVRKRQFISEERKKYIIVWIKSKKIFDPHSFCGFFHTNICVIKGTPNFTFVGISVDMDLNWKCPDRFFGCEVLTQEVTL